MRMTGLHIPTRTQFTSTDGRKLSNHPAECELSDDYSQQMVATLLAAVSKAVATKESQSKKIKSEVIAL